MTVQLYGTFICRMELKIYLAYMAKYYRASLVNISPKNFIMMAPGNWKTSD